MDPSTAGNGQAIEAATHAKTQALSDAPAIAMGNVYEATAQALGLAALNATSAQQQGNITAQASTTMGVSSLYSVDAAATSNAFADEEGYAIFEAEGEEGKEA